MTGEIAYEVIWVSNDNDIPSKGNYRAILGVDRWGNYSEVWVVDGCLCRLDGPCHIIGTSSWWSFGEGTRLICGPSTINGKPKKEEYSVRSISSGSFLPRKFISKEEWLREQEIWLERQKAQEIKDLVI